MTPFDGWMAKNKVLPFEIKEADNPVPYLEKVWDDAIAFATERAATIAE